MNDEYLTNEIGPEIKRVTLHPVDADGNPDTEVNLYPKTLLDGIVDREGKPVEVQEKLIDGENIKTINGDSILGSGNIEIVDAYTKEESNEKFLSKEAAAETYETIINVNEKFATKEYVDSKENLIKATWTELKALRDSSKLIPGRFYRITDYTCTTTQENTSSAGHVFDIIVLALDTDKLSEEASAIQHEGDTYFANNKLEAWKLWYCLDNDTSHFAWALDGQAIINLNSFGSNGKPLTRQQSFDGPHFGGVYSEYQYAWGTFEDVDNGDHTNFIYSKNATLINGETVYNSNEGKLQNAEVVEGKGVIYRMIDEFGNDCPYDFKNIQFKRKINLASGEPTYDEADGTEMWCYTFTATSYNIDADTWSSLKDGSLESPAFHMSDENTTTFKDNKIEKYIIVYDSNDDYTKCGREYLSNNVFLGYYEEVGTSSEEHPYYYAYCCFNNKLGYNCYNNTFGKYCYYITFGDSCFNNTFGDSCYYNTFGNDCSYNTFGNWCTYNTFGNHCNSNTFGNNCDTNTLGNDCYINTLGNGCNNNTFGNHCSYHTFGNDCNYNTFGSNCYNNRFGSNSSSNTFGNNCGYIIFGTGSFFTTTPADYYQNNIVDNGCIYLYLNSAGTASDVNQLQNVHIHSGVEGDWQTYKTITLERNLSYITDVYPRGSSKIEV